jgi:hypothetical protein
MSNKTTQTACKHHCQIQNNTVSNNLHPPPLLQTRTTFRSNLPTTTKSAATKWRCRHKSQTTTWPTTRSAVASKVERRGSHLRKHWFVNTPPRTASHTRKEN